MFERVVSHGWIGEHSVDCAVLPFQLLVAALGGWFHREQADVIAFLREENRVLKARLTGQRLRFDDGERRLSRNWDSGLVVACLRRSGHS